MNPTEVRNMIALTRVPHLTLMQAKNLYEQVGSATAIIENHSNIREICPDVSSHVEKVLKDMSEVLKRADMEMDFITKKNIKPLCFNDDEYPYRLKACPDAPLILFQCGNANLNPQHVISIVGTRRCTQYGKDICKALMEQMKEQCPDMLIVSGLAYGIDINAHRAALQNDFPTVGVLAHGLDRIYPATHRQTAIQMLEKGGLLTEYISGTTPEKCNFIRRNCIVAGIADATIVVESASRGGALITAELAHSYDRDIFAFPGKVTDEFSVGCNNLIYQQKAGIITSAVDLLNAMGWEVKTKNEGKQQELFVELSEEQLSIVDCLKDCESKQINQIAIEVGLPVYIVSGLLYELEEKGVVEVMGGARYRLLRSKLG